MAKRKKKNKLYKDNYFLTKDHMKFLSTCFRIGLKVLPERLPNGTLTATVVYKNEKVDTNISVSNKELTHASIELYKKYYRKIYEKRTILSFTVLVINSMFVLKLLTC